MSIFEGSGFRVGRDAAQVLHEASEGFLTGRFESGNAVAIHAKRKMLLKKDLRLVKYIEDGAHR